jgi:hypothetical protein
MARTRSRGEREVVVEAPPQNDVYTVLLGISLLATLVGLGFIAKDWSDYSAKAPKSTPPASISQPAEAPAAPGQSVAPAADGGKAP